MPVRPFGKPTSYRLRVAYKQMIGDVVVAMSTKAEGSTLEQIKGLCQKILTNIQAAGGYEVETALAVVDQHGNTRPGVLE